MKIKFFNISIIFCLCLFGFTNNAEAKKLKFIQITDSHLSTEGSDYRNRKLSESENLLKEAIKSAKKEKGVDFVLFTGDNIDEAKPKELVKFLRIANKLHKPHYVIPGNHEPFRYENFDKKKYMRYVWLFNPRQLFDSTRYVFKPNKDFVFIAMDGANELLPSAAGYYREKDLEWLDKKLSKYKDKKVVIFQHYPLIEPYKKRSHRTVNVKDYFSVLDSHTNVVAVISGHYHDNKITKRKGVYHISTHSLINPPHSYRVIEIEYKPKYLFSNPSEFNINTKVVNLREETEEIEMLQEEQTEQENNETPDIVVY